jgi:O-antigen ligase
MNNIKPYTNVSWITKTYPIGFFIILILPLLVIQPWFLPPDWGKTLIFRSVVALLLLLFAFELLYKKKFPNLRNIKKNSVFWLLIVLAGVFLLAAIFSVDPHSSFWGSPVRSGGIVTFLFYIAFAILLFVVARHHDWRKIFNLSIIVGVLVSLVGLIQFYGLFKNIFLSFSERPPSTIGNPIFLSIYILLLFFITLSFFITQPFESERQKIKKIGYFAALVIFFWAILVTDTRATFIGLFVGTVCFLLMYPKKMAKLKIITVVSLVVILTAIFYINSISHLPAFLEKNTIIKDISSRISLKNISSDQRFAAWKIAISALKAKPLLGWGPENFQVGFDKFYSPSIIPYDPNGLADWWDRAHNIFLDIGTQAGILGLLAYFALFGVVIVKLQQAKRDADQSKKIIINGVQATLIGYLVANLFSFDTFTSYLLYFLLIGYAMHIIYQHQPAEKEPDANLPKKPWKPALLAFLSLLVIIFLWQYNIVPLVVNAQINNADIQGYRKNCDKAFSLMDSALTYHSFLDAFARIQYAYLAKECIAYYPQQRAAYAAKGIAVLQENKKIQPLYTRLWMFLGDFATTQAKAETDPATKINLVRQAYEYLDQAKKLSPKRQEILLERTATDLAAKDYTAMNQDAENCIALDPNTGDCYWQKAIAQIYQQNLTDAKKNIDIAAQKKFRTDNIIAVSDLADAYLAIKDYQDLALIYEKLIAINGSVPQYHTSLAVIYKNLGEYQKARAEALRFLELVPSAKNQVDEFLKTLPQ